MRISAFSDRGHFYKGNLHTHTGRSDGKLPVRDVIDIYKKLGYDFISITDHNRVFKSDEFNEELYILPGLEIHSMKPSVHKTHHMVALTTYENKLVEHDQLIDNVPWTGSEESAVKLSAKMKQKDMYLVYCHPVWSRMDPIEYIDADFEALEVYNGICEYKYNQGNQELHWDYLLRRGKKVFGVAADDCHGGQNHNGRGFVMVKCDELSDEALLESLRSGNFYASRGPLIHDFYVEDGKVFVNCSESKRITFISYEFLGGSFEFEKPVCECSMRIHPETTYVRVEVEDAGGLKAWSNPIFLK